MIVRARQPRPALFCNFSRMLVTINQFSLLSQQLRQPGDVRRDPPPSLSRLPLGVRRGASTGAEGCARNVQLDQVSTGKYAGIRGDGTYADYSGEFLPLAEGPVVTYITFEGSYRTPRTSEPGSRLTWIKVTHICDLQT